MLSQLTAIEAAQKIRNGEVSSRDLVNACLERIKESDEAIGAWAFLDPELALSQADAMDNIRARGRPIGSLHGVPVGIKDIYDTSDMPTARGSAIFEGRQPNADCAVVEKLREAGAVIMGKTVTTELAFMHPSETRNPHNSEHTPGGSSSGSAAAVAAGHVPLAIGSQTNGSVIRPASYCGVYGFKPTRGVVSRRGCLETSRTLDQVGGFARSLADVALLHDAIAGYDAADAMSYLRPRPAMLEGSRQEPPVEPTLVWLKMPFDDRLDQDAHEGLTEVVDALGNRVERIDAPSSFADIIEHHRIVHESEFLKHLGDDLSAQPDKVSDTLKPILDRARSYSRQQYVDALAYVAGAETFFAEFFNDYDAIICPAATGEAPLISAGGTGDPIYSTIPTFAGLPCVTLPILSGSNGLPVGVQLIGQAEHDDRLMRTSSWLLSTLAGELNS